MTTIDMQGRASEATADAAKRLRAGASLTHGQGADFSTFLKMLTTQMQNQNPLNPIEASDFAVQLATFSGVEQQVQTNQLLSRLTERLLVDDMSTWLGTEVATEQGFRISGEPVTFALQEPPQGVTRRDLVLQTETGLEALRLPLGLGQDTATIDPASDGPTPLLSGAYRAKVEEFRGDDLIAQQNARQFLAVREVRQDPGGLVLVLASGQTLAAQDVVALRKPSGL